MILYFERTSLFYRLIFSYYPIFILYLVFLTLYFERISLSYHLIFSYYLFFIFKPDVFIHVTIAV